MSLFALIHPIFKFLLEFFSNSSKSKNIPGQTGDRRILFKLFLLMSTVSFILNIHLIIIGLQTNKRLQDYKQSVENKRIIIKDLEECSSKLSIQKEATKVCHANSGRK